MLVVCRQVPGQPRREAAWWGPKDDRALLQGYFKHGGILWVHKAITAAVDSILSDASLDFSVKVMTTMIAADRLICHNNNNCLKVYD